MKFAHFGSCLGKSGHDPGRALSPACGANCSCATTGLRLRVLRRAPFSARTRAGCRRPAFTPSAAGARTKRIRLGGMGHIVPLHHPLRLTEEIALADNMIEGRLEVGLVPGITPANFGPFGVNYETRREVTMEFVDSSRPPSAPRSPSTSRASTHTVKQGRLAVLPMQRPHPPLWIETRDPDTLAFCAKEGIKFGIFLSPIRASTQHAGYRRYLEQWRGGRATDQAAILPIPASVCRADRRRGAEAAPRRPVAAFTRGFLPR